MRHSATGWKLLTLVVAATSLVVQPLATGVHLGSSDHHWCAEHETLEHGCEGDCEDSSSLEQAAPGVLLHGAGSNREHEHGRCQHNTIATDTFLPSSGSSCTTLSLPSVCAGNADVSAHIAIGTLTLAPKTSPPIYS